MIDLLAAAALFAVASPSGPQAPPDPGPALFVVHDANTTVYIFGTFHALDRNSRWFGDKIRAAFERSNELVLETVIPEKLSNMPVTTSGFARLQITPSASFLATTRMAIKVGRAQGMQVDNGADMILRHVAQAEGKPVQGLETLQLQVNMFNRMPATVAAADEKNHGAAASVSEIQGLSKAMAEMQAAWKRGDQAVFVRILNELRAASPDTYRMMFVERNSRWADWVRARMQRPGTVFVAVGAGHLAGPDSLLVRLAERGFTCKRVN